jgi:hypothetical protein
MNFCPFEKVDKVKNKKMDKVDKVKNKKMDKCCDQLSAKKIHEDYRNGQDTCC